jgi:hypothetical protein
MPILVPAILKSVVKLLRVAGKRLWIAAPTKPYTTVHAYSPPRELTAIQQKDSMEAMSTTRQIEFRGPNNRSARKLGMMRPGTPRPFMVIRRLMESEYGRWIIERPKDVR